MIMWEDNIKKYLWETGCETEVWKKLALIYSIADFSNKIANPRVLLPESYCY